ncbi:hypothetical protein L873DRAFT_165720 [Choiromyces venosus 120613-1]|uniref:Uncharacterized protein n=1 Tax=Choiromyces venosus 120613-1 TaxID=1336337 RepID=A0A3N4JYQ8_9PEZI|nr:hypothetical protein L873DRAFT_165720 [Choiromyces venosus 120613-1]
MLFFVLRLQLSGISELQKRKQKYFVCKCIQRSDTHRQQKGSCTVLYFALNCTVCLSSGATFLSFGDYCPPPCRKRLEPVCAPWGSASSVAATV